jgi:small conductance mechanosensitive channel
LVRDVKLRPRVSVDSEGFPKGSNSVHREGPRSVRLKLGENNPESVTMNSRWLRVGFLKGLVFPSLLLLLLALALFVVEVKLQMHIPHPILTTTALWTTVGLVAVFIFSRSINVENLRMREEKVSALRKTVVALLSLVVVFGALARFGVDLSAYLLGLGVGAIMIGFAAQSTISNFISGILVVMEKTINTGDYVKVNVPGAAVEGEIEEIAFLRTRVVTNDGVRVSVPNTLLVNTTVSNFTLSPKRPLVVSLNISNDSDPLKVRERLMEATKVHFGSDEAHRVHIRSIQGNTVNLELWIMVSTQRYLSTRDEVVQKVSRMCDEEKLTLNSLTTT